jgi:acid phosphatase (class A)
MPAAAIALTQPAKPNYFDPATLVAATVIGHPPALGSPEQKADLAEVHRLHDHATPEEMRFAQTDANSQNIWIYSSVLGPGFNGQALPLTAALGLKLRADASTLNNLLKARYLRPRPFAADPTLQSTCGFATETSYPSGHAMFGYLSAFVTTAMVPEKTKEILARADLFAEHRVLCAVHYPADVRAGRAAAAELFGNMLANPAFQHDLAAARAEVRNALHLDPQ